ncbi:molybdopterin molybdotransferase MoeA [Oecophyllibacter saccharovorans]|uniref:molybdopterin molybdotransferase MoeA n=1 Tax=Oecophyllibacter saccharovorans TaxID=2558360 RepID=UPI0011751D2E|nr:molybdopterin molybdotransferase MoeA [Oecophyllibacter saccharovorans]TPW36398.1 molybdopterin molybdotransferase MoeA [Oecophyllibacter saccharovorans]
MAALTVAQAEECILAHAGDFGTECLPLGQAAGRLLRQEVRAERDQPPYDRVMMDGIACRADAAFPLTCTGLQGAGQAPQSLPEGNTCIEIMTGAVLPHGADCVVPVERLRREGNQISLQPDTPHEVGQFIHPRGADCRQGVVLLRPGQYLGGPALAVLAANGVSQVQVGRLPSVGIISTGDELVAVDAPVEAWQIRRSNDIGVQGLLAGWGVHEVQRSWVRDALGPLTAHLQAQLAAHDVLILSGGVSMGVFDHVPQALEQAGVKKVFHRVLQRPGGPVWFGIGPQGQRVFGLPGNPVSAMVCAARYVSVLLRAGQLSEAIRTVGGPSAPELSELRLSAPVERLQNRTRFLPVQIRGAGEGVPCPVPTSGDFMTLAQTDGIVELPSGAEGNLQLPAGSPVRFYGW